LRSSADQHTLEWLHLRHGSDVMTAVEDRPQSLSFGQASQYQ
jgi:hypothetical protein